MPEHVNPINPSPEDRFADALDAITLGLPFRQRDDASLAAAARTIGNIGLHVDGLADDDPVSLDRAARRRIWADLMREYGGTPEAAPNPKSPGPAGSTLSPNPWLARSEPPKPGRPRPASGVLRFIPAAQPTGTFLLVVAVLVLVGGTFATLAPDGGRGVISDASATEHPSQLAYASPEASPFADACLVEATSEGSTEALPDRLYRSGGSVVPELHEIYVLNRWEQVVTCGGLAGAGEIPRSLMTDRRTVEESTAWIVSEDEARAILGYPLAWHELEEMERIHESALEANPGFTGDPLALDVDLGVVRPLADGRIAFYSGAYWLAEDRRIESSADPATGTEVTVHIFAHQDRLWLYDESLRLCIGACEGFETSGPPMPQLTVATPDAADRQWLAPLRDASCPGVRSETGVATPNAPAIDTDPADYVPFVEAAAADQVAAATIYQRIVSGCDAPGDESLTAAGGDIILGAWDEAGTTQSQIDTAEAISEALGVADPIEILLASNAAMQIQGEDATFTLHPHRVLLPRDVVRLPDGRMGGMLRVQVLPGETSVWFVESRAAATLFVVFDLVDGEWTLSESFSICVGQCQGSDTETTGHAVATATPVPAASPVATKR